MKAKLYLLAFLVGCSMYASAQWNLNGNNITSGQFLGTINNFDLVFRASNVPRMVLTNNASPSGPGCLGIGTMSPTEKLHVNGGNAIIKGVGGFSSAGHTALLYLGDNNNFIKTTFGGGMSLNVFNGADLVTLHQGGSVGINVGSTYSSFGKLDIYNPGGTYSYGLMSRGLNPLSKAISAGTQISGTYTENFLVYANGTLFAREIWVKVGVLGDFVFEPDYKLMSLYDVEKYVKENKHLPSIPSEKEVQKNNMNVGDMQALQLQKIEELTLYVIELQKQIDKMKTHICEVEKQLGK